MQHLFNQNLSNPAGIATIGIGLVALKSNHTSIKKSGSVVTATTLSIGVFDET